MFFTLLKLYHTHAWKATWKLSVTWLIKTTHLAVVRRRKKQKSEPSLDRVVQLWTRD